MRAQGRVWAVPLRSPNQSIRVVGRRVAATRIYRINEVHVEVINPQDPEPGVSYIGDHRSVWHMLYIEPTPGVVSGINVP